MGSSAVVDSASAEPSSFTHHKTKTTEPEVALNNLKSQLNGQIKLMGNQPKDLQVRSSVVGISLARFKLLGKSEDLTRAIELAESATTIEEKSFAALFLRARGRAAAHASRSARRSRWPLKRRQSGRQGQDHACAPTS